MNKKVKVFAAACGVLVALVATSLSAFSSGGEVTVVECRGDQTRVCLTKKDYQKKAIIRVYGEYRETTVKDRLE